MVGEELAQDHSAAFRVVVEGAPRHLHPDVRDETYWIGREALSNAFCHAAGREIEVEISYDRAELRVRFRGDGCGIEPEIIGAGGRSAHWELRGMGSVQRRLAGTWTSAPAQVHKRDEGYAVVSGNPRAETTSLPLQ
jgi:nitrate/nitrite-specific signal transduction histidine kinase